MPHLMIWHASPSQSALLRGSGWTCTTLVLSGQRYHMVFYIEVKRLTSHDHVTKPAAMLSGKK